MASNGEAPNRQATKQLGNPASLQENAGHYGTTKASGKCVASSKEAAVFNGQDSRPPCYCIQEGNASWGELAS